MNQKEKKKKKKKKKRSCLPDFVQCTKGTVECEQSMILCVAAAAAVCKVAIFAFSTFLQAVSSSYPFLV